LTEPSGYQHNTVNPELYLEFKENAFVIKAVIKASRHAKNQSALKQFSF